MQLQPFCLLSSSFWLCLVLCTQTLLQQSRSTFEQQWVLRSALLAVCFTAQSKLQLLPSRQLHCLLASSFSLPATQRTQTLLHESVNTLSIASHVIKDHGSSKLVEGVKHRQLCYKHLLVCTEYNGGSSKLSRCMRCKCFVYCNQGGLLTIQ